MVFIIFQIFASAFASADLLARIFASADFHPLIFACASASADLHAQIFAYASASADLVISASNTSLVYNNWFTIVRQYFNFRTEYSFVHV